MSRMIATVLTLLLMVGCATTENYNKILDTWIGADITDLMDSWGYPQGSFDSPNGNKVYVYSEGGAYTTPVTTNTTVVGNTVQNHTYGGITVNYNCTTYIETDDSGTIVTWSWEGNNCVAYPVD